MSKALWRIALVLGGVLLLVANADGEEGTILGFYPPTSAGTIGFDAAKLAIAALAVWFIYRGIRPRRTAPAERSAAV